MRVLGIDPGSQITGLGVVEQSDDGLVPVFHHSFRLPKAALSVRLGMIYQRTAEVIQTYAPDIVAVEQVFVATNAKVALTLGHARGSAVCAAVNAGCELEEYSALQIKRAVVGTGSASKEQVQHMVRVLLGLRSAPPADAADALACAICQIHTAQVTKKLQRASVNS